MAQCSYDTPRGIVAQRLNNQECRPGSRWNGMCAVFAVSLRVWSSCFDPLALRSSDANFEQCFFPMSSRMERVSPRDLLPAVLVSPAIDVSKARYPLGVQFPEPRPLFNVGRHRCSICRYQSRLASAIIALPMCRLLPERTQHLNPRETEQV